MPAIDGGTIAMNNILQGLLNDGHEVQVLCISTLKHPFIEEKYPQEILEKTKIRSVFVDTRVNIVDAFSSLITRDSYNINRFFSTDLDIMLKNILSRKKFDIIHIESLFMTPYLETIKRLSKAKVILRSHNLEYMIWERMASGEGRFPKKAYLKYLAKKLKDYEISILSQVDGVVCISNEDEIKYRAIDSSVPITTIPFGIDLKNFEKYNAKSYQEKVNLFHIGSMDWSPNLEALIWFLSEIWMNIHKKFPKLELVLGGRNMPSNFLDQDYPNVRIVGEIDDAYDFMKENGIMIVPLLSAGGIRVKIIEGMALKKTIISTQIGAEGINYTHGENIFIANDNDAIIQALENVINDEEKRMKIGASAHQLIKNSYDNDQLMSNLIDFYESV